MSVIGMMYHPLLMRKLRHFRIFPGFLFLIPIKLTKVEIEYQTWIFQVHIHWQIIIKYRVVLAGTKIQLFVKSSESPHITMDILFNKLENADVAQKLPCNDNKESTFNRLFYNNRMRWRKGKIPKKMTLNKTFTDELPTDYLRVDLNPL